MTTTQSDLDRDAAHTADLDTHQQLHNSAAPDPDCEFCGCLHIEHATLRSGVRVGLNPFSIRPSRSFTWAPCDKENHNV
jgi:hypothetical protein